MSIDPEAGSSFVLPFVSGKLLQACDGRLSMLEMVMEPNGGPPPHIHLSEDEYFYVLGGEYVVEVDGRRRRLTTGGFEHVPPGVRHSLRAGPSGGRHLTILAPGGAEGWFFEAAEMVGRGEEIATELYQKFGMRVFEEHEQ